MRKDLIVGKVYRHKKQYYVALSKDTLATFRRGRTFVKITRGEQLCVPSEISVQKLCEFWGVSIKRFDKFFHSELYPKDFKKEANAREKESRRIAKISVRSAICLPPEE